jgi:NAD(P)-dependent dehydrogenase (short-subunit alcohol dehydrogenase family)
MQLADQVAIMTGAARGIGLATARCLAEEGARIGIADINGAGAHAFCPHSGQVNFVLLDFFALPCSLAGMDCHRSPARHDTSHAQASRGSAHLTCP